MTVIIRDATDDDEDILALFMQRLNIFEHTLRPDRDRTDRSAVDHIKYLKNLIKTQGGFALIAQDAENPIGFLIGLIETEEGSYVVPEHRRYGLISDLYVSDEVRGMGIGKQLLAEAESKFATLAIDRIQVSALESNTKAGGVYRATGYDPLYTLFEKKLG